MRHAAPPHPPPRRPGHVDVSRRVVLGLGADLPRKLTMSLAPFSEPAGAVPGRWLSPPEACRSVRKDAAAQNLPLTRPPARPGVLFEDVGETLR